MIQFDSEDAGKMKIAGPPKELAIEIAALAKTIHDMMLEYDEDMALEFEMNLFMGILAAFENNSEEKKRMIAEHEKYIESLNHLKILKAIASSLESNKPEDIRRSEFDSDEEFKRWFHGEEEEE